MFIFINSEVLHSAKMTRIVEFEGYVM